MNGIPKAWFIWTLTIVLSITSLSGTIVPVGAQTANRVSYGGRVPSPVVRAPRNDEPDTLLVMPNSGADKDEVATALQEVHGTVVRTVGTGGLTTLVVRTEKGQLDEVEKKLTKDSEHFSKLQRNPRGTSALEMVTTNDPYFASEWHLAGIEAALGWNVSTGSGQTITIADGGCQGNNADLAGKCYAGDDYIKWVADGKTDYNMHSHGTIMATIAAGARNNNKLTAGVCDGYIYPIRIADENEITTDLNIILALYESAVKGIHIFSCSYGIFDTSQSYANASAHPVLHEWLKWYHDSYGGIAIFSAGNDSKYDPSPLCPYMIMCSGIGTNYKIAKFSNYGKCIWFTGPAELICASNKIGKLVTTQGTSCVPPMIAGMIAMIWAKYPSWSNKNIEQMLIRCCQNYTKERNDELGYGLPSVNKALSGSCPRALGDESEDWGGNEEKTKPLMELPKHEGPPGVLEQVAEKDILFDPAAPTDASGKAVLPGQ